MVKITNSGVLCPTNILRFLQINIDAFQLVVRFVWFGSCTYLKYSDFRYVFSQDLGPHLGPRLLFKFSMFYRRDRADLGRTYLAKAGRPTRCRRILYDQIEPGRYYVACDQTMRHWHDVLGENVYRVRYEELVADQEGETRKLLEQCGLPWEQACLNFHQTDRVVRTASAVQVRQPIYDSSIRRWQPYRHQLSDLLAALGPVIN